MKDLSQLLFLSCWGLASATWLRSCDIQSGEVMIIPQLNELSFDMPIFMYIQEGTRFRNGSQWYLCRLPFAIFMCDRVAHLWHPDLELEDKEEKGEEVPVEQAIVSWTHQWPAFEGWSDDPIHGAQDGVAGLYLINILNIYSAIIVVIIFSLICANLYSQNTFQERQREKQTCVFFQSLRTSKYPERSTWCHSTTWGADQEIAVWSGRSQGGLSFRRLSSPHFLGGWKWWSLGCQWYQPFNKDV